MFAALSQAMSQLEYGRFAFAFSGALILAQVSLCGQQQLVLKLLPTYIDEDTRPIWRGAIAFSLGTVALGSASMTLVMAVWGGLTADGASILTGALLILPMAFAEYQSSVLRAQGHMMGALLPRDVLWRIGVITVAGLSITGVISPLSSVSAIALCAAILTLLLIGQSNLDPATRYHSALKGRTQSQAKEWRKLSTSFWVASVVTVAAPNLSVVAIGSVHSPLETGPFFAALKTAQLLTLVLLASNLAATPLISRAHRDGDTAEVRKICRFISGAAGAFAIVGMLALVVTGKMALSVFGSGFTVAYADLLIIGLGFAVSAICGPNGVLLQMAGEEGSFARLSLFWNGVGTIGLVPAVWLNGTIGAAVIICITTIAWNLHAWVLCRTRVGIDPSIVGVILPAPTIRSAKRSATPQQP